MPRNPSSPRCRGAHACRWRRCWLGAAGYERRDVPANPCRAYPQVARQLSSRACRLIARRRPAASSERRLARPRVAHDERQLRAVAATPLVSREARRVRAALPEPGERVRRAVCRPALHYRSQMKKKSTPRLKVRRETLRVLDSTDLKRAAGGGTESVGPNCPVTLAAPSPQSKTSGG
jgi:hypothetical protein